MNPLTSVVSPSPSSVASRRRPRLLAAGLAVLVVVAAACSPSGGLGTVPPATATPTSAPSADAPDLTPQPTTGASPSADASESPAASASPSASPTDAPAGSPTARPTAGPTATPRATPAPTEAPVETIIVRTYGILPGGPGVEGLVPTLQVVPQTSGVARAALEQLLAGRLAEGVASAIPQGTRLLGLTIRDGVAVVDLSREFEGGGGSASTAYRLGQLVYTLTQFDSVRAVLLRIEGRTVTTFGSEGIVLDGPQTRTDYAGLLPSIFVDRPAYQAAIGNPARIVGDADVFEATFMVTILDGDGRTVAETHVTASCGTGCRGTFDERIRYDVDRAQWGTLRVWVASARDGQPEDVREYPVWLTPEG